MIKRDRKIGLPGKLFVKKILVSLGRWFVNNDDDCSNLNKLIYLIHFYSGISCKVKKKNELGSNIFRN